VPLIPAFLLHTELYMEIVPLIDAKIDKLAKTHNLQVVIPSIFYFSHAKPKLTVVFPSI